MRYVHDADGNRWYDAGQMHLEDDQRNTLTVDVLQSEPINGHREMTMRVAGHPGAVIIGQGNDWFYVEGVPFPGRYRCGAGESIGRMSE